MRTFTKTYLGISLLIACGPTPGIETTSSTSSDSSTSTGDPTTGAISTTGADLTTGTGSTSSTSTGEPEPFCSPSAFCDSDGDCPESAHCSAAGVCATECDPTCSEECMTADPPCPAPCDKQCATGCTAGGECLFCDVGDDTGGVECTPAADIVADPAGLAAFCMAHPLAYPDSCGLQPLMTCEEVLLSVAASGQCSVTSCDYLACAKGLLVNECGDTPSACAELAACLGQPANCCELNGQIEGTELCAISEGSKCVDCDGKPALCQTVCSPAGEPCCLNDEGETVACQKISFCTNLFCEDFEAVALASGVDPEVASKLGSMCDANRCQACDDVAEFCMSSPCGPDILQKCEIEMQTCLRPKAP